MRVRDRPALHNGPAWKEGPRQEKVLQGKKNIPHSSLFLGVIVQKGVLVIVVIHLSALLNQKGCVKHTDKAGGEPKKRNTSMVVSKVLQYTQEETHCAKVKSEG